MRFIATPISGNYVIELQEQADDRGIFARTFCSREFAAHGLNSTVAQCSVSFTGRRGTLRGLHYQRAPYEEAKLVRCTRGAVFDVAVDLRRSSSSYLKWHGVELSEQNRLMHYIPEGCAHGLLTLCEDTEVHYSMSQFHQPAAETGVRWDDPSFGIVWPAAVQVISERDRSYLDFAHKRS